MKKLAVIGLTIFSMSYAVSAAIPIDGRRIDWVGTSYGLYNFPTRPGEMAGYLKHTKYKELTKLKPGTPEFDAKWLEIADKDPEGFSEDQRGYTERAYYDPAMAKLKSKGIDFSERGPAIQDMVFSVAVQYGTSAYPISRALRGKNINEMSDADIVTTVQEDKYTHRYRDFASSLKKALPKGVIISRICAEERDLLNLAGEIKRVSILCVKRKK
ncbi:MAG: hypothetical protein WDW20_04175 [Neisseriaceae bacterium]